MLLEKTKKIIKNNILLIIALGVIFSIGYYLRSYHAIYHGLDYSPYEAYDDKPADGNNRYYFTDQISQYPTKLIIKQYTDLIFGDFYILYVLGFIAIFLLGKEFTNKWGGLLAVSLYAISPENLLHYTTNIKVNDSGLSYVSIFFTIFFITKYIKSNKPRYLIFLLISSVIAMTSYHTGSTAMMVIIFGIFLSLLYSNKINLKKIIALSIPILFYLIWTVFYTKNFNLLGNNSHNQLNTIGQALMNIKLETSVIYILTIAIIITVIHKVNKNIPKIWSWKIWTISTILLSAILIFINTPIFNDILKLGVNDYYISTITLNNILAQIIITHIYIIVLLPIITKKDIDNNYAVIRGWLIGIVIIASGLVLQSYYSRIPDYSFPLMFILFAIYWTKEKSYRYTIVIGTIIVIIISQIIIFNDPFSMRRYYTNQEIKSAKNIVDLNIQDVMVSDLRTAALLRYMGRDRVEFYMSDNPKHNTLFYHPENIPDMIPVNYNQNIYAVISKSMAYIVYSTNFQTMPVDDKIFRYYSDNYPVIYEDEIMTVYRIYSHNNL